jgi:hypothetical protein
MGYPVLFQPFFETEKIVCHRTGGSYFFFGACSHNTYHDGSLVYIETSTSFDYYIQDIPPFLEWLPRKVCYPNGLLRASNFHSYLYRPVGMGVSGRGSASIYFKYLLTLRTKSGLPIKSVNSFSMYKRSDNCRISLVSFNLAKAFFTA